MENNQKITINGDGGFNQTKIIENLILSVLDDIMVFDDEFQTYKNMKRKIKELTKDLI